MHLFLCALAQLAPVLAESPYVPLQGQACPSNFTYVRVADALSSGEQSFLSKRDVITNKELISWLGNSNLSDFDASSFLGSDTIRIGLAYSGGGYRAMLSGAGQLAALDNRITNTTGSGQLGGLLQASTYLAGLSGGNWLVGSLAVNNFSSVQDMQSNTSLWSLKNSLLSPGGVDIIKTFGYWDTIIDDVDDKQDAGWNVSLTDLWGRGLGYQMFNASDGGRAYPYSNVRNNPIFQDAGMPFPIHVTDRRSPDEYIISLNSSVFEFNPYEIGCWDPNIYHFADLKYLGTYADNYAVNSTNCTINYDNAGFMIGTSATLFNQFLLRLNTTGLEGDIYNLTHHILQDMSSKSDDVSIIKPNPFYGIPSIDQNDNLTLTLVDGGEDNQNIPLVPLIQPQRNVDIIFAFDNSADTDDNWPAGTSLMYTYRRQFGSQANGTHFPYVPDNNTFLYGGYTMEPTFFGCSLENQTSLYANDTFNSSTASNVTDGSNVVPLVVYIANSAHSFYSNVSTFDLKYSMTERDEMIQNGFNVMTQNNGTLDSEWRTCLACAVVLRSQQRRGESPTEQCQKCFTKYCWDGSIYTNSTQGVTPARRDGLSNLVSSSVKASDQTSGARKLAPSLLVAALAVSALFI